MGSARENLVPQDMDIEKKPTDMTGSTRKKSRKPQIERFPSVRTIPPGNAVAEAHKRKNAAAESALQRRRFIMILMILYGKRRFFPVKLLFRAKKKGR